jgi:hypothetical protein
MNSSNGKPTLDDLAEDACGGRHCGAQSGGGLLGGDVMRVVV